MKRPHLKLESQDDLAPKLSDRALENLRFIRETMERAGTFTAISGRGISGTGVIAVVAYALAGQEVGQPRWLSVWIGAALLALVTSVWATYRKARDTEIPLSGALARKLALAFLPALVTGVAVTAIALRAGWFVALPGVWLIMYGAAVMAGGALSVPVVPVMGASFMLLGAVALGAPVAVATSWATGSRDALLNALMLAGFGGLHLLFGTAIARRYGG